MWNFSTIRIFFGFEHWMSIEAAGKYWDVNIRFVPEARCRERVCVCVTHWSLYWMGYLFGGHNRKKEQFNSMGQFMPFIWKWSVPLTNSAHTKKNHMLPFAHFLQCVCPLPCTLLVILLVQSTYGFYQVIEFPWKNLHCIEQITPFCSHSVFFHCGERVRQIVYYVCEQLALEE